MKTLLSLLAGLSLSGTLMAAALMLLRRALKDRLPSAFYYYAWLIVLLRFVLPLPGLLPLPGESRVPASAPAVSVSSDAPAARPYAAGFSHLGSPSETEEAAPQLVPSVDTTGMGTAEDFGVSASALRSLALREVLRSERFWLSVWVIGMVCHAVWYLDGYRLFRKELAASFRRPSAADLAVYDAVADEPRPRLYRNRSVHTPMLLGIFHPVIVLPDQPYSETMLQGVLAHEMTHCRRHDVLFKWFAVLVTTVHWFNPVTRLFRSELDRSCELACDEMLLRHMDAGEKQLYGDMLIAMAAERRLPRSVVATSFAVEKRNLKERLTQIMTYKHRRASLALILTAVLLLSACGAAAGPGISPRVSGPVAAANVVPVPEPTGEPRNTDAVPTPEPAGLTGSYAGVTVETVDELLAALASDTIVTLMPGFYDLSAASDYGKSYPDGPYTWVDAYDGYELVIRRLDNLVLNAEGAGETLISAVPRYAEVLRFENCTNISLRGFTAGHTQEPGQCAGGVLDFDSCLNVQINACRLYGCGVLGIKAENCTALYAADTAIYECSQGAVRSISSKDLRFTRCEFYDCGVKEGGPAFAMFQVQTSTGFAVLDSNVHENNARELLNSLSADEVYFLGNVVGGNQFSTLFDVNLIVPIVDGCDFRGNRITDSWLTGRDHVLSPAGGELGQAELEAMTLALTGGSYAGPVERRAAAVTGIPAQDGMEYHVSTTDELLAAIGSDRTIYLEGELFDWSDASAYGGYGGDHYYWVDEYDGPSLVISNVRNLRLIGQGKDKTTLQAVPRYADVLCFYDCENITVAALTAGHLKEAPGSCSGDVLAFEQCQDVHVVDCGLFGCGVYGIRANNSVMGDILRTEIYECSGGAAMILRTDGFVFTDCSVHDCVSNWGNAETVNRINLSDSGDCSYNGVPLRNGGNEVGDGSEIGPYSYEGEPAEAIPAPANPLKLYFFETEIYPGVGFTMYEGDSPVTLTARLELGDSSDGLRYRWLTSNDACLKLTPSADGSSCEVAYLAQPLEGSSVGLLVIAETDGAASYSASAPVYLRSN